MKWLIIVVVLLVLLGVVWLRVLRQPPTDAGTATPHRLDDSLEVTDDDPDGAAPRA